MQISNSYNQAPNFRAISFKPEVREWNKDVLNAALESKYVHEFVSKSAKNKEDVVMSLSDAVPEPNKLYTFRVMNFQLKSPSQSFSMKSVARPKQENHTIVYKDINEDVDKDVAKDLASQLRAYGVINPQLSQEEKLQYLSNLALFKK